MVARGSGRALLRGFVKFAGLTLILVVPYFALKRFAFVSLHYHGVCTLGRVQYAAGISLASPSLLQRRDSVPHRALPYALARIALPGGQCLSDVASAGRLANCFALSPLPGSS
jgi:hypothetical protein